MITGGWLGDDGMDMIGFDEMVDLLAWLRNQLLWHENRARQDGSDVLLDIETKRRILERCEAAVVDSATDFDGKLLAELVLRLLASAYAARPGYREQWKITTPGGTS